MTQAPRPAPFFVGESTALDFLNSIATPRTVLYDWLETGPDLLDWMVTARLVTETEAASFRKPKARAELEDARAHPDPGLRRLHAGQHLVAARYLRLGRWGWG